MRIDILFDTNRFNLSEIKPHFINDCCFGEDCATWLGKKLQNNGLTTTEIFQEDWGWAFYIEYKEQKYFIGINGNIDEKNAETNQGQWRIMIDKNRSFMEKILGKNNLDVTDEVITATYDVLIKESDFKNITIEPFK